MNKQYMVSFIQYYGGDCDTCDCENCDNDQIEECYYRANENYNDIFAESIGYGGYDSSDEFWDNLLE